LPAHVSALAVPAEARIPVELTQQVTSLTGHVGDVFTFKTVKAQTLGATLVPAGTPGHGRIAVVTPAHATEHGTMSLQADSLDLPDGNTISVNVDTKAPIRGHLSDKHTHFVVVPLLIGIVPIVRTTRSGNLVLDPGTRFSVVTTTPRTVVAPLLTAPPTAMPAPSAKAVPSAVPSMKAERTPKPSKNRPGAMPSTGTVPSAMPSAGPVPNGSPSTGPVPSATP